MCTAIVYKKTHDSTFLTVSNERKNVSFEKKKKSSKNHTISFIYDIFGPYFDCPVFTLRLK